MRRSILSVFVLLSAMTLAGVGPAVAGDESSTAMRPGETTPPAPDAGQVVPEPSKGRRLPAQQDLPGEMSVRTLREAQDDMLAEMQRDLEAADKKQEEAKESHDEAAQEEEGGALDFLEDLKDNSEAEEARRLEEEEEERQQDIQALQEQMRELEEQEAARRAARQQPRVKRGDSEPQAKVVEQSGLSPPGESVDSNDDPTPRVDTGQYRRKGIAR